VLRRPIGACALGVTVTALGAIAPARAGVEVGTLSPRAIGHAGAAVASDDGGAAVFTCPAAIARRDTRRAQLAGLAIDDEVALITPDHPRVKDGGGATLAPAVSAAGHLGPVVLAVAYATTEAFHRDLPVAGLELPAADVAARFPHRYAGSVASVQRQTVGAAAAIRPTEWLALGVAVTLAQVDLEERRRLWAGFAGRDPLAQPTRDVDVDLTAGDGLVPGGALGALIAPLDAPLEVAVGASWSDDVRADGDAAVRAVAGAAQVAAVAPATAIRLGSALTANLGVRWLGERYAIEGAATWTAYPTGADAWAITGVELVDESGARARLTRLPSRLPRRGHGALAAAVDVEVIPGFAWLALGYRWTTAASALPALSTVGADLGGHTLAAGLELSAGDATITIGVAHQLSRQATARGPGLALDNPFPGGVAPANLGAHATALDLVGIGLELSAP